MRLFQGQRGRTHGFTPVKRNGLWLMRLLRWESDRHRRGCRRGCSLQLKKSGQGAATKRERSVGGSVFPAPRMTGRWKGSKKIATLLPGGSPSGLLTVMRSSTRAREATGGRCRPGRGRPSTGIQRMPWKSASLAGGGSVSLGWVVSLTFCSLTGSPPPPPRRAVRARGQKGRVPEAWEPASAGSAYDPHSEVANSHQEGTVSVTSFSPFSPCVRGMVRGKKKALSYDYT